MAAKRQRDSNSAQRARAESPDAASNIPFFDEKTLVEVFTAWGETTPAESDLDQYAAHALLRLNGVAAENAGAYMRTVIQRPLPYRLSLKKIRAGRETIVEWPGTGGVACWTLIPFGKRRAEIVDDFANALDEMLRSSASAKVIRHRSVGLTARDLLAFTLRGAPLRTLERYLAYFRLPPLVRSKTADLKTARRNAILRGRQIVEEAQRWPGSRVILVECAQLKYERKIERAAQKWKVTDGPTEETKRRAMFALHGQDHEPGLWSKWWLEYHKCLRTNFLSPSDEITSGSRTPKKLP